jgi:hypothetical protein
VCDGFIDEINNINPLPSNLTISAVLSVRGWSVLNAKEGSVPDAMYLTLTDPERKVFYLKTDKTSRPDVKAHLGHPAMPDVGYAGFADVSNLSGNYILGVSRLYAGKLEACQQFNIPIHISSM